MLFFVGSAIGLAIHGREEWGRGKRLSALLCFAGAVVVGIAWAAGLGYLVLRAYQSIA